LNRLSGFSRGSPGFLMGEDYSTASLNRLFSHPFAARTNAQRMTVARSRFAVSAYSVPANPACVTTLPQRAISAAMKRSSSSDEAVPPGIMPSLTICC
jgi:hypothetical protein